MTYDFGWWRCATLTTLTPTSQSRTSFYTLSPSPISLSQQQLSGNLDEEPVIFRHDPDPDVYNVFIDFNPIFNTMPVDTTAFALPRLYS